jgi:hypothetical protein
MTRFGTLFTLAAYALAMALVEAAVVVHLRHLYYPADPQALFPLVLLSPADLQLELARELATVVMIGAVAVLAERGAARRFAAFVFVFGLWDLGYYAWLELVLGWPRSWLEWDVLFLIPWPWFGPWLAPALIALLFTLWGGWMLAGTRAPRWTRGNLLLFVAGAALGLGAFLAPGGWLLPGGEAAFRGYLPAAFAWPLFLAGFAAMAAGLLRAWRQAGA